MSFNEIFDGNIPKRLKTIEDLRKFLKEYFSGTDVKVYLFGSRARGGTRCGSDIDVGIDSKIDISSDLAKIRYIVEESNIPYKVDIVDLSRTSEDFRNEIMEDAIEW